MKITLPIIIWTTAAFFSTIQINAQTQTINHYPGGVAGAEMWYIVNHQDLSLTIFRNHSEDYDYIGLTSCKQDWQKSLFNFNPSITTEELCLLYNAPLENTTVRNIFFVGEPKPPVPNEQEQTYSHVTTNWNQSLLTLPVTASPVANRFDLSNKNSLFNKNVLTYSSDNNANINFYGWSKYELQNKLKSFGKEGETEFSIGKFYNNQPNQDDGTPAAIADYFEGKFPEYISFPFELTYNQRNRVESYLALKYGITLVSDGTTNYRNAVNTVFWNQSNSIFWNRIFGIGRDDISGLNQLQSESTHFKDYLIASVGELQTSNADVQLLESINNNHFIVFGDEGSYDNLMEANSFMVQPLKRKWLSQSTGENASIIPVFFKVSLQEVIKAIMNEDPALKLWMLHDKFVNNTEISDFNNQYVDYYQATSLDGLDFGLFENVFFDTDEGIFDQFTFGVGPEMIVQIRFDPDCDDNIVRTNVVITGGVAPYRVTVSNTNNYSEVFSINENTMSFDAIAPDTYTVYVDDSAGNEAEIDQEVELQQIDVNLGPDIVLNQNQQQVTLDATQGNTYVTYKWYFNGELLQYFEPTLLASEPGTYKVEVMSDNHMCEDWDEIEIGYNFTATAVPQTVCGDDMGSITFTLDGGVQPAYSIHIHNEDGPMPIDIFTVANEEYLTVEGVLFGMNTVIITDGNDEEVELNVDVTSPLNGIELDLINQLDAQCIPEQGIDYPLYSCYDVTIDGSLGVTNSNVSYEWFLDGQSIGLYDPLVELYRDDSYQNAVSIEVQLVITNLDNGCSISDTFGLTKGVYIRGLSQPGSQRVNVITQVNAEEVEAEQVEVSLLESKVYPIPVEHTKTFYYEIWSNRMFNGTVEIFSATGAIIHQQQIEGKSEYKIPLTLLSSGNYVIKSTTSEGTVSNQIIIK